MIIIIDAYNYLKNILHVTFVQDYQINACIKEYKEYALARNNQIMLIFDAGPYDQITYEDVSAQVTVMYSGAWCSADDVIKDLIQEKHQEDILLVSSDRELCAFADMYNVVSIGVLDFHEILHMVMKHYKKSNSSLSQDLIKTSSEENPYVDQLMEFGSRNLALKDQAHHTKAKQLINVEIIVNKQKLSKLDKKLIKKLNKI